MDRKFQNIINQLTKQEQTFVQKTNINTLEKLLPLLLKRISLENSEKLIQAIKEALKPSTTDETKEHFNEFFEQITINPKLLFEIKTIDKIKEFIEIRVKNDKENLISKTNDVSAFINSMQIHLNEAIDFSGNSCTNVHNIKEEISVIDFNDSTKDLNELKERLISFSSSIENEMSIVSNKLKDGKNKICELQDKIKNLEIELSKSRNESKFDHLTGLLNRRSYDDEVEKYESNFERLKQKFAVVFFDLDHFKKINDEFGHDAGDIVLSTFAKILNKATRKNDVVCRYGGEEFVSLVHYNKPQEIVDYAYRIKNIIDNNSFVYRDKKIKVTFSAGIAYRNNFENYKDAVKFADNLLYQAKREGRNIIKTT